MKARTRNNALFTSDEIVLRAIIATNSFHGNDRVRYFELCMGYASYFIDPQQMAVERNLVNFLYGKSLPVSFFIFQNLFTHQNGLNNSVKGAIAKNFDKRTKHVVYKLQGVQKQNKISFGP